MLNIIKANWKGELKLVRCEKFKMSREKRSLKCGMFQHRAGKNKFMGEFVEKCFKGKMYFANDLKLI